MFFRCLNIPCIDTSFLDKIIKEEMKMEDTDEPLIVVPVPPLKKPGDRIAVQNPDENGSIVYATVPPGKKPGQTFMVRIPCTKTVFRDKHGIPYTFSCATKSHKEEAVLEIPASDLTSTGPSTPSRFTLKASSSSPSSAAATETMLVNVPPGAAPGTILNVPVPGKRRFVKAEVPPGVSQFYVTYEQRTPQTQFPTTAEHKRGRFVSSKVVPPNVEEMSYVSESRQYEVAPQSDNESQQRVPLKYFPHSMYSQRRTAANRQHLTQRNRRHHQSSFVPVDGDDYYNSSGGFYSSASTPQHDRYNNRELWDSPLMEASAEELFRQQNENYRKVKSVNFAKKSASTHGNMRRQRNDSSSLLLYT